MSLEDVPIAVSVVSGAQLTQQNINAVVDLTRSVPSLNVPGPFGALSIRESVAYRSRVRQRAVLVS